MGGYMKETPLCKLAYKYGTDKCPKLGHTYTPYYYKLFKNRRGKVRKVAEMGVGRYYDYRGKPISDRLPRYKPGASLRMWRDFFPNATIYGADIVEEVLFSESRIKTKYCDERKGSHIKRWIKSIGKDIDIFIDDGIHIVDRQVYLAQVVMKLVDKDIIYIIEDVKYPKAVLAELEDFDCKLAKLRSPIVHWRITQNNLVVVKHK
jgi:hypothetical protein